MRRFLASVCVILWALSGASAAVELRISNLEDLSLGEVGPTGGRVVQRVRACVSMTPAGPFQLTASGTGRNGGFALTNGTGDGFEIPFDVFARQRPGGGRTRLIAGVASGPFAAREPRPNGQCRPPHTVIIVNLDRSNVSAVPPGRYSGLLQLMVAPE